MFPATGTGLARFSRRVGKEKGCGERGLKITLRCKPLHSFKPFCNRQSDSGRGKHVFWCCIKAMIVVELQEGGVCLLVK